MRRINVVKRLLLVVTFIFSFAVVKAQTTDALGTYTPFSLYGLGDIDKQGTAFNKGMGGIGVGVRDNRFINYLNPASITERDTLSFMLDFGLSQRNFYAKDNNNVKSAYNTANMQNIMFTAPIYKKSALIVGITPYSNIGYKFSTQETDKNLISKYGNITYQKYGTGSINQMFVGAAMNVFPNLSVGAEMIYYFGAINRYSNVLFSSDASIRDINTGWDYDLKAMSGRVGAQYFGKIGKDKFITVGATYRLKTNLDGDYSRYVCAASSSQIDTISLNNVSDYKVEIPSEFAVGFSFKKRDKWMVGLDYTRQEWAGSLFGEVDGEDFKPSAASSIKLGIEYIPNRYDIRYYFKRITYRLGAYYDETYVNAGGNQVNAAGLTFGMSLPIYRWYNALTWSVDVGRRGSIEDNMVRENYVQFNINFNLHDIWFVKKRYN